MAFHHGTITKPIATLFLPAELRGYPEDPRSIEFVAKLVKSKDALRRWLVTDTLVPLVLKWIDSEAFVQLNITSVRERTNFWAARIKEDNSLLAWWLIGLRLEPAMAVPARCSSNRRPKSVEEAHDSLLPRSDDMDRGHRLLASDRA